MISINLLKLLQSYSTISSTIMTKITKIFLRLALAVSFLSAVADRLGYWDKKVSVWGTWDAFLAYTQLINPYIPNAMIETIAIIATVLEVVFAFFLLIGYKTAFFATLSGLLLLVFALSMTFSTGIKGAFDYSVFTAAAGAFALSLIDEKFLEVDALFSKKV